ncbi:blue copper protein 1b-like [Aristolochia californica]|uniref:blue copper protein 1b-like n=1 Tax=Aristolochia californica TaxID=171875 RepID=UPI0035DC146E
MGLLLRSGCCLFLAIFMALATSPVTTDAAKIIVGGVQRWHFGFNYSDWACKTGPFYINDTLVFKYDPPSNTTFPHNVYLLKNIRSYRTCNLKNAKVVGGVADGGRGGLQFVLKKSKKPYFFACGVGAGLHCSQGLMKFAVLPIPHVCIG